MKAASNAISLATMAGVVKLWRAPSPLSRRRSCAIRAVLALLEQRGVELAASWTRTSTLPTSGAPAQVTFDKPPVGSLADRLLVGALIEARSCERFRLLADALGARGDALAAFYDELFACEARHYTTMLDLAVAVRGDEPRVRERLADLARAEGAIAARLGVRPTIHG